MIDRSALLGLAEFELDPRGRSMLAAARAPRPAPKAPPETFYERRRRAMLEAQAGGPDYFTRLNREMLEHGEVHAKGLEQELDRAFPAGLPYSGDIAAKAEIRGDVVRDYSSGPIVGVSVGNAMRAAALELIEAEKKPPPPVNWSGDGDWAALTLAGIAEDARAMTREQMRRDLRKIETERRAAFDEESRRLKTMARDGSWIDPADRSPGPSMAAEAVRQGRLLPFPTAGGALLVKQPGGGPVTEIIDADGTRHRGPEAVAAWVKAHTFPADPETVRRLRVAEWIKDAADAPRVGYNCYGDGEMKFDVWRARQIVGKFSDKTDADEFARQWDWREFQRVGSRTALGLALDDDK